MTTTGLRELRQQASELVRQAEAGETITVTVSGGREVAELGPVRRHRWRRYSEVAEIFRGPVDEEWAADAAAIDSTIRNPFE